MTRHPAPAAAPAADNAAGNNTTLQHAAAGASNTIANVMKAGGFYNKHADFQGRVVASLEPLLRQAVALLPLAPDITHIGIAEYGCSQGANSVAPVRVLANALDERLASLRLRGSSDDGEEVAAAPVQVMVTHEDLPANDFGTLMLLLADPDRSYTSDRHQHLELFAAAVGRSFYERVMPAGSVHLGFSCSALHWLRRAPPVQLSGATPHWFSPLITPEERAIASAAAVEDLRLVLSLRAQEFVHGGLLVISMIASGSEDDVTRGYFAHKLHEAWQQLLAEGTVAKEELCEMANITNYHRSLPNTLAAVPPEWRVLHASSQVTQHPAAERFAAGELSAAALADVYVNMWRAVYEQQLVDVLEGCRGSREAAQHVVDAYYACLGAACRREPGALEWASNVLLLQRV